MAYLLRSMAVIGVIALNSPVHGERSPATGAAEAARSAVAIAVRIDPKAALGTATAAREAAEILAGLDPQTRERMLKMTLAGATGAIPRR